MIIYIIGGLVLLTVVGYGLYKIIHRPKKYLKSGPFTQGYRPLDTDDNEPFESGSAYDVYINKRK